MAEHSTGTGSLASAALTLEGACYGEGVAVRGRKELEAVGQPQVCQSVPGAGASLSWVQTGVGLGYGWALGVLVLCHVGCR